MEKYNKEAKKENEGIREETMKTNQKDERETEQLPAKVKHRGWKVMPLIIGNETFEKLGSIGTISNLLIYLTTVFNMKSITAATTITAFKGTTYLATLVGAVLCDSRFGRYHTLAFSTIASFLGLLVIQLSAAISKLHPPYCESKSGTGCQGPSPGQMAFLLTGFGLLVIGAAGIRPCNFAFGADQFNPETESGKRGINSFFNWYVFTYTFSQMVSLTVIVYVQTNISWAIGLAIPAGLMLLSCILFFAGSKMYVKVKATGSPVTSVAQVIAASFKKRKLKPPEHPRLALFKYIPQKFINSQLVYTGQFRFFDKAAMLTSEDKINPDGSPADPWNLCSMQQVEELKCLIRIIPIWVSAVIYYLPIVQQNTYMVFQALQSDRRFGNSNFKIPAASFVVFLMMTLSIFLVIYDRVHVPFLTKITGKEGGITILQRIGTGIVLSTTSMVISGIVETHRRHTALAKPTLGFTARRSAISSMSSLLLIPQLAIAGLAESFASVGQIEFYYKQFAENMRSIGGSLFFCGIAVSSYLSSLMIFVVHKVTGGDPIGNCLPEDLNKGKLDCFYYVIAGLGMLNFGYFLVCARWYKYKGELV